MIIQPPQHVIDAAIFVASQSPCAKSKRGVVIFDEDSIYGTGSNNPPAPLYCNGSVDCREHCNKLCVHAEVAALLDAYRRSEAPDYIPRFPVAGNELLHIKTVLGDPVPGGAPSCWQCSRQILDAKIAGVWLLHEAGWRRYTTLKFHEMTLRHHGLPVIRTKEGA